MKQIETKALSGFQLCSGRRLRHVRRLGLCLVAATILAQSAYAQFGGNEAQIGSFFTQAQNWLVAVLGSGFFVVGLIFAGLSMVAQNKDGIYKALFTMAGGAFIFLSPSIGALIRRFATGF